LEGTDNSRAFLSSLPSSSFSHFPHHSSAMDAFRTLTGGSRFDKTRFQSDINHFQVRPSLSLLPISHLISCSPQASKPVASTSTALPSELDFFAPPVAELGADGDEASKKEAKKQRKRKRAAEEAAAAAAGSSLSPYFIFLHQADPFLLQNPSLPSTTPPSSASTASNSPVSTSLAPSARSKKRLSALCNLEETGRAWSY
jgi:hypothetical protein